MLDVPRVGHIYTFGVAKSVRAGACDLLDDEWALPIRRELVESFCLLLPAENQVTHSERLLMDMLVVVSS